MGNYGKDTIITYGYGEKDKVSGDNFESEGDSDDLIADFDTFVIGGEGTVQITDYQIGEEIILLDYYIQSVEDITVNYDFVQDQTSLNFISGTDYYLDRVLINGRLEIDSFEQTTFNNQYTQNTICLLYTSPSPRDAHESRMPSSA